MKREETLHLRWYTCACVDVGFATTGCAAGAGASRTDAGAHATGQVAHLDVTGSPDSIQPDSLMMYLNGVLPPDVKVQQLQLAPQGVWALTAAGSMSDLQLQR